jgi:hypothetical protein
LPSDCFAGTLASLIPPRITSDAFRSHFEEFGPSKWWLIPGYIFLKLVHFSLVDFVGPIVAIVSVEGIIIANQLTTVGIKQSTGQMIAVFTGVCSMCVAFWELGKTVLKARTPSSVE